MATERTEPRIDQEPLYVPVSWGWVLQRVSAVLLVVFVGGHLWVEHYMNTSTAEVTRRLSHWVFAGLDIGLLVSVVFHGLNGLYSILREALHGSPRWLAGVLWGLGIFTVFWGTDILWAFLYYRPFLVL